MRKIRIMEHISLDGVTEHDRDYEYAGWSAAYRSPEGAAAVVEASGTNFDLLLGRTTYDIWSGYWPTATGSPMAEKLNAARKYIATHRPESLAWGPVTALGTDIIASVRNLKAEDGPDLIIWGSSSLTSPLLEAGLVDELVLITYPVLLGRGKRLFADKGYAQELALVSTKTTSAGVCFNTYRYVGPLKK